ncbi:YraN family protein [Microbacterium indicum]|uniref:YraN family protein n=1 Tax=Microbacterium indicum TaxID=358100 RepID=UPI00048B38E7|nr:YraN family protein [Microbacterium indicum]
MTHNTTLGAAGEERAARHLALAGYEVLDRNWRCAEGELDIVAARGRVLAIVEVKTRTSTRYGHPLEALDDEKVRRLWRLGHAWVRAHPERARGLVMRVDAIAITGREPESARIEHLEGLR